MFFLSFIRLNPLLNSSLLFFELTLLRLQLLSEPLLLLLHEPTPLLSRVCRFLLWPRPPGLNWFWL